MKKLVLFIALALCVAFTGTAMAATATETLGISAQISAAGTCTLQGTSPSFGAVVPPITANVDTYTFIGVTCPTGTPYSVALSTGGSGDFTQRQMSEAITPANKLNYNVYSDATHTSVWGDGTGSTGTVNGTGTSSYQSLSVYFRIPAQATPAPGDYSDSMTITVTY